MITACNQSGNPPQENIVEETNENPTTTEDKTIDNTSDAEAQATDKNISLAEYQEKIGCYVTTESGHNLKDYMSKDESKIIVSHEKYGSNTFCITTYGDAYEYQTTISLSEGVRTPDIYSGFTSEKNGYIIIFHMEDYAVSPMDDIELACVLKTTDGGKTWKKTEYRDFAVSNGREYITHACFFSDDVGFFTARYYCIDHFASRTYWTLDGGLTWTNMPRLDLPDMLEPFGYPGYDFATEITDLTVEGGVYILTVRICHGLSLELDGNDPYTSLYINFSSANLIDWDLKK
jgi:hypothetical protein